MRLALFLLVAMPVTMPLSRSGEQYHVLIELSPSCGAAPGS
jgi:hypothetical protein